MCMIKDLAERYNVITGLSDHTIGSTVPIVATTFGAKIIEKHFIIMIGIDRYGESAPAPAVFEHVGITVAAVKRAVEEIT